MRPSKVKIIGKVYELNFITGEPLDEDDNGECDNDKQVLSVREGLPLELSQDCALHESIHALDEQMGINLKEAQVKKLATGLLAMLRENPRFVSFLRKRK